MLQLFLLLASALFAIGLYGVLSQQSIVMIMMGLELMLNGVTVAAGAFWHYLAPASVAGQVIVVVVLVAMAVEMAMGFAVTTGRSIPAWPKDALRISFGIIWLIDAALKWLPGFRSGYMDMIMGQAQGQPGWLKPWFTFWINLQHPQATFFAYLVAAVETLIAVAVILGFARKITYISAAAFSVLIWATAEGFGGPYTSGAADIGTAIIYAVFFLGLLALMGYSGPARYSVDYYLEQKISWWWKVAEVRRPVQDVPAPAVAAIIAGPAASTAVVPQPRTAQPVISAPAVTASPAGPAEPAEPAASDEQVPAGQSSA